MFSQNLFPFVSYTGRSEFLMQNFTSSFPIGCREMHSFGFVVKTGAQILQKALDISFASPGNHSPGNEGLKGQD